MDAPLALYRRYRPDTFSDVIGQDHVTGPLSQALDSNRVHHAYLFSGPRGCGKTTSARILARALNCEKGPVSAPCGGCESCLELARGGPGSVDVIEIDAASHGGVDDARELRERAFFSPMKSRYKVYIIDEAHMVSSQGFNALLKLVEEPPAHLRFIFATTEPDKVIGTIKSRTHHYPFRLVPPKLLGDYLVDLCSREGVAIDSTVVPLVVRAGAGSVRDTLSVLDQLIGGSGPDGVTYELATSLLGFTPASLLDATVDALAADDAATLFAVVDKVVDSGQDPRRFAEDLLHRLRDLVVVSAVPDAAERGLLDVSADQAERLNGQATRFGRAELTRAADIVSQGLTELRGATAPRLLLEIMCARVLLPGLDSSAEGLGSRLERLERRLSVVGDAPAARPRTTADVAAPTASAPDATLSAPPVAAAAAAERATASDERPPGPATASDERQPSPATAHAPAAPMADASPGQTPDRGPGAGAVPSADSAALSSPAKLGVADVRQLWPGVLDRVKNMKRYAWLLLSQNAQVKDVTDGVLTISFGSSGACANFRAGGAPEILRQALIDELGVDWRVEAIIEGADAAASAGRPTPAESAGRPGGSSTPSGAASAVPVAPAAQSRTPTDSRPRSSSGAAVPAASAPRPSSAGGDRQSADSSDADVHDDDEVVDDAALTSEQLLARELGAQVIDDIRHDEV